MNSPIRPRILTHRGVVAASALCLDPSFIGEIEARRRVLNLWQNGAQLFEVEGGYLLRFAAPRPFRGDTAPGTPLVEREGWLVGAPLSDLEWKEFRRDASLGAGQNLLLVRDGALQIAAPGREIDPSEWLDGSVWNALEMQPLGEIAALPVAAPPLEFEARRALAVPASPELDAFLARMRGEKTAAKSRPAWADFWSRFGTKAASGAAMGRAMGGGIRVKGPFSLGRLFAFRFGARDDSLPAGERFSSEFGLVARIALMLAGVALFISLLCGAGGGIGAIITLFLALLLLLLPVALLAWGLMSLARLWPVPPGVAAKMSAGSSSSSRTPFEWIPFDLLALFFYCGLFLISLSQRHWGWMALALIASVFRAFHSQWQRRRLDERRFDERRFDERPAAGAEGASGRPPKPKRPPSGAWQRWLWQTELGRLVGAYQARYILKMMAMFERGDLDGALRHAVPFSVFGDVATHPSLSLLKARNGLDFLNARGSARGGAGGGGLDLPSHIREKLTQLYRAAHESLAAQNRVDEAAFVLAELLDSPAEAVQFLEKHGKWPVAAQLSEARELEPGLTVRLWWIAGNRERAVASARRGGAWADAIARLERSDATGDATQEGAQQLRLIWAQSQALSGDFAGAVEAAWPLVERLPALRGVVGAWIERGLEGQGSGAARMLARQAHLLPDLSAETVDIWRDRTRDLLDDADQNSVPLRLQFADLLSSAPTHDLARAAARRAVRALARDATQFPQWSDDLKTQTKKLLDFAGDSPLRADWLALSLPAALPNLDSRAAPLILRFEAQDVGSREVFDGILLPDGRVLVALGESGAQLLSRGGGVAARFAQPCHRLVASPLGERIIGVARRGGAFLERFGGEEERAAFVQQMGVDEFGRRAGHADLCRFDLARQTVSPWGELRELGQFAPVFDGSQWVVGQGDALCSLDATAATPLILWRTKDAGIARRLSCDDDSLAMLTDFYARGARVRTEMWRFDLPALILRERRLVPPETSQLGQFITPSAFVLAVQSSEAAEISIGSKFQDRIGLIHCPASETVRQVEVRGDWLVVMSAAEAGISVRCFSWHNQSKILRCQIELGGARHAWMRLSPKLLCLSDSEGRFIALDLDSGAVRKNLRVR